MFPYNKIFNNLIDSLLHGLSRKHRGNQFHYFPIKRPPLSSFRQLIQGQSLIELARLKGGRFKKGCIGILLFY
jgi:hypothetical protein